MLHISGPAPSVTQSVPGIAATDLVSNRIYQRSAGSTAKTITFSGTYTFGPVPSSIEVQIINTADSSIAQAYTALSSATIAGGNWSGTLSVPQGGMYNFKARSKDSGGAVVATTAQSTNLWGVGIILALLGQSNTEKMTTTTSSPPAANSRTRCFPYDTSVWTTMPVGNGARVLANQLQATVGIPVGIFQAGQSGTPLHGAAGNGWLTESSPGVPYPGSPYALFKTALNSADFGGDFEFVLWHQGETDAVNGTSTANYKTDLDTLYSRILTSTGRSTSTLKFGCAIVGHSSLGATGTDASWSAIRSAQLEWIAATPTAFFLGATVELPLSGDEIHWTAAGFERAGRRYAQAVLNQLGLQTYGSIGPKIASATCAGGSADVYLTITQNAGSGLTTPDGATSGTGLTAFEVSNDSFSTTLTISSTAFSAGQVKLTLSAPLSGTGKVRYQYGENPSPTGAVYDNFLVQSDTLGLPLQPTDGSITIS